MSTRRWRRRRSGSTLALAALALALVLAWPAAPVVAQAAPATTAAGLLLDSNCLLGVVGCSPSPQVSGPCVLGVLLCGGNVISQPTPCITGLLCTPPSASPCVGGVVLCPGTIVGPGNPQPSGSVPGGGPSTRPGTTGATSPGSPGSTSVVVAVAVPPGVGLVPPPAGLDGAPNPDGFSDLLALSIRDGLSPGGSQIWPALAMLQAVLLLVIVGGSAARRVLEASKLPQG